MSVTIHTSGDVWPMAFYLHLFHSWFGILKYVNNIALTSVSRHDDVKVLRYDYVTHQVAFHQFVVL